MARYRMLLSTAVLTAALAAPLAAQRARIQDWQNRWYWGIKGGMTTYQLPSSGGVAAPAAGADWLITQRRSALYISYSRSFQSEQDTFAITGLSGTNNEVAFDGIQKVAIGVVAMVGDKRLQPYLGGGFALHILANAHSTTPSPSAAVSSAISDAASGAFLFVIGGLQYRIGTKGAVFASWQYSPLGRTYMLQGGSSSFEGGIRYAFLNARDEGRGTRSP